MASKLRDGKAFGEGTSGGTELIDANCNTEIDFESKEALAAIKDWIHEMVVSTMNETSFGEMVESDESKKDLRNALHEFVTIKLERHMGDVPTGASKTLSLNDIILRHRNKKRRKSKKETSGK